MSIRGDLNLAFVGTLFNNNRKSAVTFRRPSPKTNYCSVENYPRSKSSLTMTSQLNSEVTKVEELESILVEEVMKSLDSGKESNATFHNRNNENSPLNAFKRAREIGSVLVGSVAAPILISYLKVIQNQKQQQQQHDARQITQNFDWNSFWLVATEDNTNFIDGENTHGKTNTISHAQRLTKALEQLGPTYVKFGQALASRPDVVPPSLAAALSTLQDQMTRFDGEVARDIVRKELTPRAEEGSIEKRDLEDFLDSLVEEPVAAASIGQVYKANLSGKGSVAVKVQRPGVRPLVEVSPVILVCVCIIRFLHMCFTKYYSNIFCSFLTHRLLHLTC